MLGLLFLGLRRICISPFSLCTALGTVRVVPFSAHDNLTLQVDHIIAVQHAEGIELELGHILLWRVEVDIGIVFDTPDGEKIKAKKIN